jgi:hypothetical protein
MLSKTRVAYGIFAMASLLAIAIVWSGLSGQAAADIGNVRRYQLFLIALLCWPMYMGADILRRIARKKSARGGTVGAFLEAAAFGVPAWGPFVILAVMVLLSYIPPQRAV